MSMLASVSSTKDTLDTFRELEGFMAVRSRESIPGSARGGSGKPNTEPQMVRQIDDHEATTNGNVRGEMKEHFERHDQPLPKEPKHVSGPKTPGPKEFVTTVHTKP